jgi:hypothetical protein
LERAIVGKGGGGNDEVEKETERSETDDDAGDNLVDEDEAVGNSITEEGGLKCEEWTFHEGVDVPDNHSVHVVLSMPSAVDNESTHLSLSVAIKSLLAQHGNNRGERCSQTRIKDGLDVDDSRIGVTPWGGGGIDVGVTWSPPKRGSGDNPEDFVAHLLAIRLDVALNVDNESGCDCGEQAGL